MNSLRQIPLHMLLLAGLVGPAEAQEKESAPPAVKADKAAAGVAYAGLNVGPRDEVAAGVPAGVGLVVGFIDPKGPSVGKIEEGDVLTRLDDQMLFNAEQFRALVRTRQPGDKVKLTLQRGAEPLVVELTLGARVEREPRAEAKDGARAAARGLPPGVTSDGPGGVIPPELLKQLQDLQAGVLPGPGVRSMIPSIDELRGRADASPSSSSSFSFSLSGGTKSSSTTVASDAEGSVTIRQEDGKRRAVIKDKAGQTLFEGDITEKRAVENLPPEIRRRLQLFEGRGFGLPEGSGGKLPPKPAAEEPKKKFDPKQGA
ncbi:MAG: PDZ domain-containing protein [Verrucomicrobiota bacterium]